VVNDGSLTARERLEIESLLDGAAIAEFAEPRDQRLDIQLAAVGIASIMALIAVTATMGLVRVESVREQSLFAAIGASPRMLRLSAAAGAVLLTGAALVVGIPLGFLGQWAVRSATGSTSVSLPFVPIVALVVALPVLAGGIAAAPAPPEPGASR
jgi:ABC-type antimicrobial peptide transport system permease subunit